LLRLLVCKHHIVLRRIENILLARKIEHGQQLALSNILSLAHQYLRDGALDRRANRSRRCDANGGPSGAMVRLYANGGSKHGEEKEKDGPKLAAA